MPVLAAGPHCAFESDQGAHLLHLHRRGTTNDAVATEEAMTRNRYFNVLPFDHNVSLLPGMEATYMHGMIECRIHHLATSCDGTA